MRALISVSDKSGIVEFAKKLQNLGFEIISTGGTFKLLQENGIFAIEISKVTNFPEMFDGRVKTLNPLIHGGILYKRDNSYHLQSAKKYHIDSIDLVCVNLYPFKETTQKTDDFEEIIENIDIGGPAMIRSAAKNFKDVLIVTDKNDYDGVCKAIEDKKDSLEFRCKLMIKAYEHTANYDAMIANYMNDRFNDGFSNKRFIVGKKVFDTRYGENPHQKGALYEFENFFTNNFQQLKGEASFNNLTDIDASVKIASSFGDENAICIVKHGNPCGFAMKDTLLNSYEEALKCDPISAFGGVVAVNGVVTKELALKMNETFLEVIIAGNFEDEAIEIFKSKKRLKLFSYNNSRLKIAKDKYDFKHISGGFVFQTSDIITVQEVQSAKCQTKIQATKEQMKDLEIAYKLAAFTKSNCVTYVKNSTLVAIGMGMTSRVDAAECAIKKARSLNIDINGASMASEAFFPFRDSIDAAAKAGVGAIIEPGGSIRDDEVIEAANEYNIPLYFTSVRHFLH